MSTTQKVKTVLITGCSDGSPGAALSKAFHAKGHQVHVSARDVSKMASLRDAGIECIVMSSHKRRLTPARPR